jgi:hypothetical protein
MSSGVALWVVVWDACLQWDLAKPELQKVAERTYLRQYEPRNTTTKDQGLKEASQETTYIRDADIKSWTKTSA